MYVSVLTACGENEYVPTCVPCPPVNCGDSSDSICFENCVVNKKCYCRPGFLRNDVGTCIKAEQCGKV